MVLFGHSRGRRLASRNNKVHVLIFFVVVIACIRFVANTSSPSPAAAMSGTITSFPSGHLLIIINQSTKQSNVLTTILEDHRTYPRATIHHALAPSSMSDAIVCGGLSRLLAARLLATLASSMIGAVLGAAYCRLVAAL
jgi:hypothetical protein